MTYDFGLALVNVTPESTDKRHFNAWMGKFSAIKQMIKITVGQKGDVGPLIRPCTDSDAGKGPSEKKKSIPQSAGKRAL